MYPDFVHMCVQVPGGRDFEVNNSNRIQYIHLMADYRLNKCIKKQCDAFLRGFQDVIRVEWIRFFNPVELQVIISGERKGDFDVEDCESDSIACVSLFLYGVLQATALWSGRLHPCVEGSFRCITFWNNACFHHVFYNNFNIYSYIFVVRL